MVTEALFHASDYTREGIVRVDALFVYNLRLEGADALVLVESEGNFARHVLHEPRAVVASHRYMPLIGALDHGVDG